MKKLLFTIFVCSTLSAGLFSRFSNLENPNGEPFTLTVSTSINTYLDHKASGGYHCKLPISSLLSVNAGIYRDYRLSIAGREPGEHSHYSHQPDWEDGRKWLQAQNIRYYGMELHLPIYKLWKR